MRTWTWWLVVWELAGIGCGSSRRPARGDEPGGDVQACPDAETVARCARQYDDWTSPRRGVRPGKTYGAASPHGAAASREAVSALAEATAGSGDDSGGDGLLTSDCPTLGGCGVNGAWLGSGVQFRALHLTAGIPNDQGLQIREFRRWDHALAKYEFLRIDVQGQELIGYRASGTALTGAELIGAEIVIEHVSPRGAVDAPVYTLRIEPTPPAPEPARGPDYHQFWATCSSGDCPASPRLYTFSVTSSDGCEMRLCKPGLADDYAGGLKGTAVIFRGDIYGDDYTAQLAEPDPYQRDLFNIACIGTSISKLDMLRHTSASEDPAHLVAVDRRTTLLKALAADYCGTGYPMTEDGLPLKLAFDDPDYTLTTASGYVFSQPDRETIDAAWTAHGASCIGSSRLHRITDRDPDVSRLGDDELRNKIIARCNELRQGTALAGEPIQDCATATPAPVTPSAPFALGDYAATGNPAPSP